MHTPYSLMHVISALIALPAGAVVTLAPKGNGMHRLLGIVYVFAMLVANMAALMIYSLTGHFDLFHAFAILALAYTGLGLGAALLRPRNWLVHHVRWMTWSYLSLLAATLNEIATRLPLHLNSAPRALGVGAGTAALIVLVYVLLQPRLRAAIARQ